MNKYNLAESDLESQIKHYRSKLTPFAYNILGDFMEAEDVVQEVLNHYFIGKNEKIEAPHAYLTKAVINKSINQKKLLRNRKEVYPGEWLPAPVSTEEPIYSKMDKNLILNYSLLVLLEKLNPRERAVFILKETFDFAHREIAEVLVITIDNSRQLLKRAKQKLALQKESSLVLENKNKSILEKLSDAIQNSDVEKVTALLSANIQAASDGGPQVAAARNIISGEVKVSKFLKALWHKYVPSADKQFVLVNHKPAIIFLQNKRIFRCMIFEIANHKIEQIYIIVNPDKLRQLNFSS